MDIDLNEIQDGEYFYGMTNKEYVDEEKEIALRMTKLFKVKMVVT